jgi:two-component system response regulator (stage 0 sporulation protein A)
MSKDRKQQNTPEQLQLVITKVMHELGIPAHIKGYMFLRSALMIAVEDMSILSAVTKQLYPEIAKMYKSTPSRVERAIRHAIEIAWTRGSQGIMRALFYGSDPENRDKPTNSEFIALLADKIRLEGNCETWTF